MSKESQESSVPINEEIFLAMDDKEKFSALFRRNDRQEEQLKELSTMSHENANKVGGLQSRIEAVSGTVVALEDKVSALKDTVDVMDDKLTRLMTMVGSLTTAVQQQQQDQPLPPPQASQDESGPSINSTVTPGATTPAVRPVAGGHQLVVGSGVPTGLTNLTTVAQTEGTNALHQTDDGDAAAHYLQNADSASSPVLSSEGGGGTVGHQPPALSSDVRQQQHSSSSSGDANPETYRVMASAGNKDNRREHVRFLDERRAALLDQQEAQLRKDQELLRREQELMHKELALGRQEHEQFHREQQQQQLVLSHQHHHHQTTPPHQQPVDNQTLVLGVGQYCVNGVVWPRQIFDPASAADLAAHTRLAQTIKLSTFSGESEDKGNNSSVLAWVLSGHLTIMLKGGRHLPDSQKLVVFTNAMTGQAKEWVHSRVGLLTVPLYPAYDFDKGDLTSRHIRDHIQNPPLVLKSTDSSAKVEAVTFFTELVKHFRGTRPDSEYWRQALERFTKGAVHPRDYRLTIENLSNNMYRQPSLVEKWTVYTTTLPEFIAAEIRKDPDFVKHEQGDITEESLAWIQRKTAHFFQSGSAASRAQVEKTVASRSASTTASEVTSAVVAPQTFGAAPPPPPTNSNRGDDRLTKVEQDIANLQQQIVPVVHEMRGSLQTLGSMMVSHGVPAAGGYHPSNPRPEMRGYTVAPDNYHYQQQRSNQQSSPRFSSPHQQRRYVDDRVARGSPHQDISRHGSGWGNASSPHTPLRTQPAPTPGDRTRLDMDEHAPQQFGPPANFSAPVSPPPPPRTPMVSQPPRDNNAPQLGPQGSHPQSFPQQRPHPPQQQQVWRNTRSGGQQNDGRYQHMQNGFGKPHVAAHLAGDIDGTLPHVRFEDFVAEREAPYEEQYYGEDQGAEENVEDAYPQDVPQAPDEVWWKWGKKLPENIIGQVNCNFNSSDATGVDTDTAGVHDAPRRTFVCVLLQNSPSFTLQTAVHSVSSDSHTSASALIDTGADFNVLNEKIIDKIGGQRDLYIDSEAAILKQIECKDASGREMAIIGILKAPISFSLRAADGSVESFDLAPCDIFHATDNAQRPTLICRTTPCPLILGIPWQAANDVATRAATMSIVTRGKTFAKNVQSLHSRLPAGVNVMFQPGEGGERRSVVLAAERQHHIPPLSTFRLPVWIPEIAQLPKDGTLVITPVDTLFAETGLYYTPMSIDRDNPFIIITNSNMHSTSLSEYKELGSVSVFYQGAVQTTFRPGCAEDIASFDPLKHPLAASLSATIDALEGRTPSAVPPASPWPAAVASTTAADMPWCTSSGDPLPTLDPSIPPEFVDRYKSLIRKYEKVFHNDFSEASWTTTPAEIKLKPGAVPYHANAFRLPALHHDALRKLIERYVEEGVMAESDSPWAAPCFFVPKPGGGLRFVVDFRVLNSWTVRSHWPLPNIEDLMMRLKGAWLFSTFDAHTGFHQQPMDLESQHLTSFITAFGQFMYKRLPLGLVNAPSIFMRSMTDFLKGLRNVLAFVDDVNVYNGANITSMTDLHEEHLVLLEAFFARCLERNLKLNGKKGLVGAPQIQYLGHRLNRDGLHPSDEKVEAVASFKRPCNITQVRSFVGIVNYYRQWIKDCATWQLPLNALTEKDAPFLWSADCERSFLHLKQALTSVCVRHWPDPDLPYHLETDCSDYALGSVLSQYAEPFKVGKVLGYYSRSLSAAEINYPVFEKECLSIVASVTHFHTYLACLPSFCVHTDHKSLATLLNWKTPNRRVARWISTLSEYSFETRYRSGPSNANADALSRLPSSTVDIPDKDMPTKVICRDGMWETEGQYDRSALGEKVAEFVDSIRRHRASDDNSTALIAAIGKRGIGNAGALKGRNSPVRHRNKKFQRAPLAETADNRPAPSAAAANEDAAHLRRLLTSDELFNLYGTYYVDTDTLVEYRIVDVMFDQDADRYYVMRVDKNNTSAATSVEDMWVPYDEIRRFLFGATFPTRRMLDDTTHVFDEDFRLAVEKELPSLFAEHLVDRADIVTLPDEYNQHHYYRRFFHKRTNSVYYQLIIPTSDEIGRTHLLRSALLRAHHDESAHFGIHKVYDTLRQIVFWKGMLKDIETYIKSCDLCELKGKSADWRKMPTTILRHPSVWRPFQRVSVDLTGPFPKTDSGFVHLVMIVDHFTKWLIAVPIRSKEASDVADALIDNLYFHHGPAEVLLADNGPEITANAINSYVFQKLGSHLTNTAGYHPQSNGQVERANQTLKNAIAKFLETSEGHKNWDKYVRAFVHAANTSPSATTGYSPYLLLYGRECRKPIHTLLPDVSDQHLRLSKKSQAYLEQLVHTMRQAHITAAQNIDIAQSLYNKPRALHRAARIAEDKQQLYDIGQLVLIYTPATKKDDSKKLSKFWHGPYPIVSRINDVTYSVAVNPDTPEPVNVNRLKCYFRRPARFQSATRPLLI